MKWLGRSSVRQLDKPRWSSPGVRERKGGAAVVGSATLVGRVLLLGAAAEQTEGC